MVAQIAVLAAAALVGTVAAQGESKCQFTIDNALLQNQNELGQWCANQRSTCPVICGGSAFPNDCFTDTLTYTCTCTDGSKPNISSYSNTIESLVCQEYVRQCILNSDQDLVKQEKCLSIKCGDKDPASATKTPGGGSPKTTDSGSGDSSSATATGSSSTSTSSDAAYHVVRVAGDYGTPVLASVLMAIFGFAL